MKRCFVSLSVLFLCLILNLSCNPTTASIGSSDKFYKYKVTEAKFDLGDDEKFDFFNIYCIADENGRMLVRYQKKEHTDERDLGLFLRLSEDAGETFGKEYKVSELIKSDLEFDYYKFHLVPNGFAVTMRRGLNLLYAQSNLTLEKWSEPVQVNDEQDSIYAGGQLLQISETESYVVWIDKRRGFNLIYFSSTNDGGNTWSPNQPIDYDFREGSQERGSIVQTENGRLHVFWQDWRDAKTLVDIRYSYSDNNGVNWSESIKVNDDEKEVWQAGPTVVADGPNIYVAFADFREDGEDNDRDWNIYFARSRDNGITWDKNKRLNDIKEGIDGVPALSIDSNGNLYCVWESGRETLFGQVVFSYSNDKGETWSPSIEVTSRDEIVEGSFTSINYVSPKRILIRLKKEVLGVGKLSYAYLEKTNKEVEPKVEQKNENEKEAIATIKYETGNSLFEDDFSSKTAENWEVESGVWDILGGTYMGIFPNKFGPYISYAKFQEPEEYILQGRFRLDTVAHTAAMLHFRADDIGQKKYVIVNHFRVGAWLSIKEPDLPEGVNMASGIPLVQKRFPFRQDNWYKFTLIVTSKQIDYYVDGRLILSHKGKISLPKGKIGVGGYMSSPTYFDDISVSELITDVTQN